MTLAWSEDELAAKLSPLDPDDVAKLFATVIFKRPDLLKHVPALTEQLQRAGDISDPDQQLEVLDWIETTLPSPRMGRMGSKVNDKPVLPVADVRPTGTSQDSVIINMDEEQAPIHSSDPPPEDPECIIQFSTPVYYAKEGEDHQMVLDVMRLGKDDVEVACKFETHDGDGKAGSRYEFTSGTLVFKPGEIMKQIYVNIIESDAWSSSLEFKVVLHDSVGCHLGRYLYMCRVKVIDPDCFPSNRFEKEIRSNHWHAIPMFKLLLEYFKFNFHSNPVVNRRTKHQLITDQMSNVYFILRLYIGKVVIDKVLRTWSEKEPDSGCHPIDGSVYFGFIYDCPDDPMDKAAKLPLLIISGLIIVIPMFLLHYIEFSEVYFKIGGTSRKTLQGNLIRKFLNYDETARAQMGPSDLIMALTRDTKSLVHDGYMQLFPLAQNLGKLLMMVVFQFVMGANLAAAPVFIYPVVLLLWLHYRNKLIFRMSVEQDAAQNEMVSYATQVMTTYRLIGDYQKRPDAVEEIEKRVGVFNKKMVAADAVTLNNKYVCKYLALACIAMWNVVGGNLVLSGSSQVGMFVTNLEVFNQVGNAWTIIFDVMLKMQSALPYLQKIVTYMNLPIDLEKRMRLNRKRRALGEEARKSARQSMMKAKASGQSVEGAYAADFVPISLSDVAFSYASPKMIYKRIMTKDAKDMPADEETVSDGRVENCSMSFEQGTFIALVGIPEKGKSTLMKLIGSQIIPDKGDLLIPPHLRALHVSPQPIFFNDTLFHNLTYGVGHDNNEDGRIERVVGICRLLRVSEGVIKYLDKDKKNMFETKVDWGEVLNITQRVLLNLARAFIANPEILVIHKPTAVLDDPTADNTIKQLKEFVSQKGLFMNPGHISVRRPRTCIITTSRLKGMVAADHIFRVTQQGVEEVVNKRGVSIAELG